MFRIKICGVRSVADIEAIAESGADAVGLNFFPPSIRYLDPNASLTSEIATAATVAGLIRVGVVVNQSVEQLATLLSQIELDAIQLHGDERPEQVADIRSLGVPLIRAVKLPVGNIDSETIEQAVRPWIGLGCHLLLDAEAGAAHGGSGKSLDWAAVHRWSMRHPRVPFTLAGGLNPENVAAAIRQSGARSVDTASGVEQPRGYKNRELVQRFVDACQSTENWDDN